MRTAILTLLLTASTTQAAPIVFMGGPTGSILQSPGAVYYGMLNRSNVPVGRFGGINHSTHRMYAKGKFPSSKPAARLGAMPTADELKPYAIPVEPAGNTREQHNDYVGRLLMLQ